MLHLTSSFPRDARDHVAPFLLDLAHAEQEAGLDVGVLDLHTTDLRASWRATAERAHGFFAQSCPIYRSLHPQIGITTELVFESAG